MALQGVLQKGLLCGVLLGTALTAFGAPSAPQTGKAGLQAQQKNVDAKLAAARTRHEALQAEVAQQEQQNTAQQQRLQQRDAEIAALQQKLQAAGVPASTSSAPASH